MGDDPVAIDLNVDAALLLQHLVGIDAYPQMLALLPNIYQADDLARVRARVSEQLTDAGVLIDGAVHPAVEQWLRCLDRPDVELVAAVVDTGFDGAPRSMLRLSLVRTGATHVLALRCDDHVVIQPVFVPQGDLGTLTAALAAVLGPCPALEFEPMTATLAQFTDVPADPGERRQALTQLGATSRTAGVLTRVLEEIVRRAEVAVIEHRDGVSTSPRLGASVLDTNSGRLVVIPQVAMDGEVRSTYRPGDRTGLQAALDALVHLMPGRSWFDTRRSE